MCVCVCVCVFAIVYVYVSVRVAVLCVVNSDDAARAPLCGPRKKKRDMPLLRRFHLNWFGRHCPWSICWVQGNAALQVTLRDCVRSGLTVLPDPKKQKR